MKIVIVDDVELIRCALKTILESHGHTVVGEAATAAEAIHQVCTKQPDLLILDYFLQRDTGVDVFNALAAQGRAVKTILLTACSDVHLLNKLVFETDIHGVVKKANQSVLLEAIEAVTGGSVYLDSSILSDLVTYKRLLQGLAPKQVDVVYWMSHGLSNDVISEKMNVGVRTISNYRSQIRNVVKNDTLKKIRALITGAPVSKSCS